MAAEAQDVTVEDLGHTGAAESGMRVIEPPAVVPGVYAKIAEVMKRVETVAKRGRNEHHHYDYAMEADIVDALRPIMADVGLVMLSHQSAEREEQEVTLSGGGKSILVRIHHTFRFVDTEDASGIEVGVWGEALSSQAKASYICFTGAEKYVLMKTFLVATGNDPEEEEPTRGRQAGKAVKERGKAKTDEAKAKLEEARKIKALRREIKKALDRMGLDLEYVGHFAQTSFGNENEMLDAEGKVDVSRFSLENFEALLAEIEMAEKVVNAGQVVPLDRYGGGEEVVIEGVAEVAE